MYFYISGRCPTWFRCAAPCAFTYRGVAPDVHEIVPTGRNLTAQAARPVRTKYVCDFAGLKARNVLYLIKISDNATIPSQGNRPYCFLNKTQAEFYNR